MRINDDDDDDDDDLVLINCGFKSYFPIVGSSNFLKFIIIYHLELNELLT